MIKKLIPVILLFIGAGAGVGAGIFLRPEPEPVAVAMDDETAKVEAEEKEEESRSLPGSSGAKDPPSAGSQDMLSGCCVCADLQGYEENPLV